MSETSVRLCAMTLGLAMGAGLLAAPAMAAEPVKPKLIVAISVDQFSASLFEEWRPRYKAGLARLSQGVVYSAGYQTHAGTETCPGHSTLLTGKHPNKTGIVANTYRDPDTKLPVYCMNDPSVVLAHSATAAPVGPARMMATTLGDWMKAADPKTRVVAVSGKDRGAITMGGHKADGTFWLVPGAGLTTYLPKGGDAKQALAPVAAFNAKIAKTWTARPQWTYAHADCKATAADWTVGGKPFASKLPPDGWGVTDEKAGVDAMASPIADELTGQAAEMLVDQYKLGRGPATDLLTVSFSATDFVGHRYGTRGPEMCEQQHRLDEAMGRLFAKLDGLQIPYLVVLAADHGGSDFTERLAAQGYEAKRVDGRAIMARVNDAVKAELGLAANPLTGNVEEAFLTGVSEADRPRVLEAAVKALRAQPEMAAAFTREDLLATPIRKGVPPDEIPLKERFAMSAYAGRSPDILGALLPATTMDTGRPGDHVAGHGSPWDYDRRIPMLFWWPGATFDWRILPVETVDIAPTLAAKLGLTPPADIDGRCLPLAAGGGDCPK